MARAALRLVDPETGEVSEEVFENREALENKINGLTELLHTASGKLGDKQRRLNEAARRDDLHPAAERLFALWLNQCKHRHHRRQTNGRCAACKRIKLSADRYNQILPHLREPSKGGVGEEMCQRAIEGAAYEHYVTVRKNGSVKHHNDWELIFRNRDKVEEFANRAPYHLPDPRYIATLSKALLHLHPDWPTEKAVDEAKARLSR